MFVYISISKIIIIQNIRMVVVYMYYITYAGIRNGVDAQNEKRFSGDFRTFRNLLCGIYNMRNGEDVRRRPRPKTKACMRDVCVRRVNDISLWNDIFFEISSWRPYAMACVIVSVLCFHSNFHNTNISFTAICAQRSIHSMCSMLKCSFTLHVKSKNKQKFSSKCLAECLHDSCYI